MAVAGEEELSLERVHEAMNHYYTPELKTVILGGYAEKTVVKDGIVSTVIDLDNLDVISPYTISLHVKDALGSARLRMDAYYWAGRALLSILLPNHEPLTRIDLKSKTRGAWIQFYSTKRYLLNRVDLRDHIIGYLGGIASQIYVYGETSSTSSEDLELATGIIRTMIKASGMSEIGVMPIEPEEYQQSPKLFYTKDPSWVENSNKLTNEGAYINDSLNSLVEDKIFEVSSLCIAEAIRLLNKYRLVLDIFAEDLVRKDVLYYSDMLLIMEELEKHNLTAEMQIPEKVNIII
jgi:cell division protease FtsH